MLFLINLLLKLIECILSVLNCFLFFKFFLLPVIFLFFFFFFFFFFFSAHFEGSLGRVSTSSVHNPRQVIDLVSMAHSDDQVGKSSGRDVYRYRQMLMEIEKVSHNLDCFLTFL